MNRCILKILLCTIFIIKIDYLLADLITPGQGFNSFSELSSYLPCVEGDISWKGEYFTKAFLDSPLSKKKFFKLVEKTRGGLKFSRFFNSSHLISTLNYENENRLSLIYLVSISGLKSYFANEKINLKVFSKKNQNLTLARCGDRYISETEYGGYLAVIYYFDFSSKREKEEFEKKSVLQYVGIEELINRMEESEIENYRMTFGLTAIQVGGNPNKLIELTGSDIFTCGIKNLENCKKVSKNIVDYISNKDGLYDQIVKTPKNQLINQTPMYFELKSYSHLDPDIKDWEWSSNNISSKNKLVEIYQKIVKANSAINYRKDIDYSNSYLEELDFLGMTMNRNLFDIYSEIKTCRKYPKKCFQLSKLIIKKFENFDANKLPIPKSHFLDYCLVPSLDIDIYHGIQKTLQTYKLNHLGCNDSYKYLKESQFLDISGQKIKKIDFVQNLPELSFLILGDNKIKDPDAILSLNKLIYLDLSNNNIADLTEIRKKFSKPKIVLKTKGNPGN